MLARMKTQTTGALTDICLTVPTEDALSVVEALGGMLRLAGHTVQRVNEDNEELYSIEEVFPEGDPAMALRGLRAREGLTQAQFAERLGISQTRVSEMEHGVRRISVDMAKRIAKTFHTSYKVFL